MDSLCFMLILQNQEREIRRTVEWQTMHTGTVAFQGKVLQYLACDDSMKQKGPLTQPPCYWAIGILYCTHLTPKLYTKYVHDFFSKYLRCVLTLFYIKYNKFISPKRI